jgi:hypothetical protein
MTLISNHLNGSNIMNADKPTNDAMVMLQAGQPTVNIAIIHQRIPVDDFFFFHRPRYLIL